MPRNKTLNEMELVAELDALFQDAKTQREAMCRNWLANLCYFYGKQWIEWDKTEEFWVTLPKPTEKFRATINRIFPVIRNVINRLSSRQIDLTVNIDDKTKGTIEEVMQALVDSVMHECNVQYEVAFDMLMYSISYVRTRFDPTLGKMIEADIDGTKKVFHEGKIVIEHIPPYCVFPSPGSPSIAKARYVFVETVRDRTEMELMFPDLDFKSMPEVQVPNILTEVDNLTNRAQLKSRSVCVVREFYQLETKEHPKGRHVILINDCVAFNSELEYIDLDGRRYIPIDDFPFFVRSFKDVSISLCDCLRPLQYEYNRLRSDIVQHEELLMKPKLLCPTECGVSEDSWNSEVGEKIYYSARGGAEPHPAQAFPPPAELWNHVISIAKEFDDIAGLHDVSRGKVPSGVRSYAAVSFLEEQDDSLLGITRHNLFNGFVGVAKKIISQANQFYLEDRIIRVVGFDKALQVKEFKEGMFSELCMDSLSITDGAGLPYSTVGRQQFVMQLYQMGLIRDPQRVLDLLGISRGKNDIMEIHQDETQAAQENAGFMQGQFSIAHPFENHGVHLRIHNMMRKMPEFRNQPEEVQQAVEVHCQSHQKYIAIEQQQMLVMMSGAHGNGKQPAIAQTAGELSE